jgi:hypothetical protein
LPALSPLFMPPAPPDDSGLTAAAPPPPPEVVPPVAEPPEVGPVPVAVADPEPLPPNPMPRPRLVPKPTLRAVPPVVVPPRAAPPLPPVATPRGELAPPLASPLRPPSSVPEFVDDAVPSRLPPVAEGLVTNEPLAAPPVAVSFMSGLPPLALLEAPLTLAVVLLAINVVAFQCALASATWTGLTVTFVFGPTTTTAPVRASLVADVLNPVRFAVFVDGVTASSVVG